MACGGVVLSRVTGTVSVVVATVDVAAALEAEAEEYPDERGEILLEAAEAWRRAGRSDRARELLARLILEGGDNGCSARFTLAESYFEDGRVDEAYAELERLARDAALTEGPCTFVAELLAERGDLEGALRWYDRAVARLDSEDLEVLRGPDGWMQVSSVMLRGRREVRRRLGLPVDFTDEIAPLAPLARQSVDVEDLHDYLESGRTPRQVQMLVFQRRERAEARRRWPDEYKAPDEEYYPAAERRWRGLAASGVPAIRVVPANVARLSEFAERVGGSATDSQVKARYAGTIADEVGIAWPPPRNGRAGVARVPSTRSAAAGLTDR
jgi:tetratricopeptide (TPR) repeat protein